MIVLYAIGLALLGLAGFVTSRRAGRLERKYVAAAKGAERLAYELSVRNGNRNHLDQFTSARKTYELGRAVQKRDRLESKYARWEARGERIAWLRKRLVTWKGRMLPYTLGAVDVALVITALNYMGAVRVDPREVIETVRAVVGR
jgi:hypothetical protein